MVTTQQLSDENQGPRRHHTPPAPPKEESMSTPTAEGGTRRREAFSGRSVFVFAAIGSAVGLGNIWRFPFVAYDSGGGAFLSPYLIALLTAGIPLLLFDYSIGHRFRG